MISRQTKSQSSLLSVVIPIHNEAQVIPALLNRLYRVAQDLPLPVELVFIDDGSTDDSVRLLLAQGSPAASIRVLRLSRNFGKEAAVSAGLEAAMGNAIVLMDADLQDPPELIPDMVAQWRRGADVVLMKRRSRKGETWLKRTTAALFYRLMNRISDASIPIDTGDFRLMSRRAVDAFLALPERNRYLKGMFAWVGMTTETLEFDRDPRAAGQTKWNYLKLMQLAVDGITSFSTKPLRLALFLGLASASAGGAFGLWEVLKVLVFGTTLPGYASLIAIITFLAGVQLLCVGLLGEYIGRIYLETKQRPVYLVAEELSAPSSRHHPVPLRVANHDRPL